ncbi:DNA helicase IV [Allocatelliglobosispora scoriae]|uniref:DNA helicase IV n=1 Tax=Allocatelliglobosispora scoriae TaxID=643052 RepID=A0A841BYP4_9ACTN|nr:AAA family ATPase [Allocatelliglobosispora scoriae]MBB5872608.1 DNA helicase IV [Allocatelliglobosispora scoriae]
MSTDEIAHEQAYVTVLYHHLDELRRHAADRLADTLAASGGTMQARSEREASTALYTRQIAQADAAEAGLCFGRLDLIDGDHFYIGRLGIFDEAREPLLIDWRAPASRAFYLATALAPEGVLRRRHIRTSGRAVTGLNDEVLDLASARADGLVGEAALLAALNAGRTGGMKDIVETIQAEQDRIIRAGHDGVLVVQGGPGTGKTAVALHRAAYLLYANRSELAQRGVLIVGPNPTFLHYIGEVLPGLGETSALLSTIGDLFPGVRAHAAESPLPAAVKGRAAMAEVIAAGVRDRQELPGDEPLEIVIDDTHPGFGYQSETLLLDRETCGRAREAARKSNRLHNLARPTFVAEIISALARQAADRLGADPYGGPNLLEPSDVADIRRELSTDRGVARAIESLWPALTPQRFLTDLYASAERLAAAAPDFTEEERAALERDPGAPFTPADVPLLDEAAELLGVNDRAEQEAAERRRRAQIAFAEGALEIALGSKSFEFEDQESEVLSAHDLVDAGRLAARHELRNRISVAERAAADRTWMFGHVIVDEAQELSAMAWRMLMRRCPSRSMTLVGDVAQTGDAAGTTSWDAVLSPYVADRWRLAHLTVNYRTPAEIMAVVGEVLAGIEPPVEAPSSVRESGVQPWHTPFADPSEIAVLAAASVPAEGSLAVISSAAFLPEVLDHVAGSDRVSVLGVADAKGLEFDVVLVVDPQGILDESPRGRSDLYVALTRATQQLGVLHPGPLPKMLAALTPLDA